MRSTISANLQRFEQRSIDVTDKKHAAVAIVILDQRKETTFDGIDTSRYATNDAAIVLTIRASKLNTHAAQRALPGGRIDTGETPERAALRETHEEIGLALSEDSIIGRLDDFATRSGYLMTPVVVWAGSTKSLAANPHEVEKIHRIPCDELLRDDAPILESIPESEHPVMKMPLGRNEWVAAPTGAIIYQFREVALLGKETRVAHFEQPYFAWR
ncbi:MAG: CoA pyrophosphatase [Pseudomonadota bacterium]